MSQTSCRYLVQPSSLMKPLIIILLLFSCFSPPAPSCPSSRIVSSPHTLSSSCPPFSLPFSLYLPTTPFPSHHPTLPHPLLPPTQATRRTLPIISPLKPLYPTPVCSRQECCDSFQLSTHSSSPPDNPLQFQSPEDTKLTKFSLFHL